jgi:hypothetical protein
MADYICWARTNYFAVNDPEAFRAAMTGFSVEVITNESAEAPSTLYGLLCDDGAGWPTTRYDEATKDDVDVDFYSAVAEHLAQGHVAIFMESGHEALRYVGGVAVAINGRGERRAVTLDEIYERAAPLGTVATRAEW